MTTTPQQIISGTLKAGAVVAGDGILHMAKVAISASGILSTAEQTTSLVLPASCVVYDVFLKVLTAEATGTGKTLSAGLLSSESGGVAAGFLSGVSVAATGIKRGVATVTAGVYASTTRGSLLASFTAGTDADDRGLNYEFPHIRGATAKTISWTMSNNNWVEFTGEIWVVYALTL